MISFKVQIKDNATPKTEALRRAYERGVHLKIMADSGANVVKDHFIDLDRARHRGTTSFSFYGRAARATSHRVQNGSAIVAIDHEGIGLRRFGGTIRPRSGKYLTIPVDHQAHGKRVREFGNAIEWRINRRKGTGVVLLGGKVLYALTKKATHKPDPSVLPTKQQIAQHVTDDLHAWTHQLETPR